MDLDTKQAKSVSAIALEGSEIGEQGADLVIFGNKKRVLKTKLNKFQTLFSLKLL